MLCVCGGVCTAATRGKKERPAKSCKVANFRAREAAKGLIGESGMLIAADQFPSEQLSERRKALASCHAFTAVCRPPLPKPRGPVRG